MTRYPSIYLATVCGAVSALGCAQTHDGPGVAVSVNALELPGVRDATYAITVTGPDGVVVDLAGISADRYGDGSGAIT